MDCSHNTLSVDELMEPYVSFCDTQIELRNISSRLRSQIEYKCIQKGNNQYAILYNGDLELANIFSHLRDLGLAFSTGREWSPAEIFEQLREKGLVVGQFTTIYWIAPGKAKISIK